jgi:hypothetical protein
MQKLLLLNKYKYMGPCMGGGEKNLTPAKFMENETRGYQMWIQKIKNSSNLFCVCSENCRTISKNGVKHHVSRYVSNFIALLPENIPDGAHACIIFLLFIQQLMS